MLAKVITLYTPSVHSTRLQGTKPASSKIAICLSSYYYYSYSCHTINIYWAISVDWSCLLIIPIEMGGCQIGGLAGATPLNCRNPSLVIVSNPSQRLRPTQVIGLSVLCGYRARPHGEVGVISHACQKRACAACHCTSHMTWR